MRSIAIFLTAGLAACKSTPPTIAPREVAEISPAQGTVAGKLLPDPNSPEVRLEPGEEYVAPQLMPGNPKPVYPPDLVKLHLPRHVVSIRVTFKEDSRAGDIRQSPVGETTSDEYAPAFEAAVRDAAKKWICYPASIRTFRDGPGYRIMTSERRLKTFFDISFAFEVVNGQPMVRGAQ